MDQQINIVDFLKKNMRQGATGEVVVNNDRPLIFSLNFKTGKMTTSCHYVVKNRFGVVMI